MSTSLGLTYHEKFVQEYLQFARMKRSDCLRSIQSSFDSLSEAHLLEDTTFTTAEVRDMLNGIWKAIEADLEAELIHSSHLTAILTQQLFQQAESVHFKMQLKVAELENTDLIEEMAAYEQQLNSNSLSTQPRKVLEPLNFTGGNNLLQKEIDRLTNENTKLKERIKMLEMKASSFLEEKDKLRVELSAHLSSVDCSPLVANDKELSSLQNELTTFELKYTNSQEECKELQEKLDETTIGLLRISKELERTKDDLEQKFADTAQYQTMKTMLKSKNEQLKDLRQKLAKYEQA